MKKAWKRKNSERSAKGKKKEQRRKKQRKDESFPTEHHPFPKSRGGPPNGWNKIRGVRYYDHKLYHGLFGNLIPDECIGLIKHHWTNQLGGLRYEVIGEKLLINWICLFGEKSVDNTNIAIEIINRDWVSDDQKKMWIDHIEQQKKYLANLLESLKRMLNKKK